MRRHSHKPHGPTEPSGLRVVAVWGEDRGVVQNILQHDMAIKDGRAWLVIVLCCMCAAYVLYTTRKPDTFDALDRKSPYVGDKLLDLTGYYNTITLKRGTGPGNHAYDKTWDLSGQPARCRGLIASFKLRMHRPFEFSCGGKIGGFHIGEGEADGLTYTKTAASARIMWSKYNGAYAYIYSPKDTWSQQPDILDKSPTRESGVGVWESDFANKLNNDKFVEMRIGVLLNTFDSKNRINNDGALYMRVGDIERYVDRVIWRTRKKDCINTFSLGIFHGGPCDAKRQSKIEIKDLKLHKWK